MNIVSENHADSFGGPAAQGRDGLFLAVIGEGLRDTLLEEHETVPESMLVLIRSLDRQAVDRGPAQSCQIR